METISLPLWAPFALLVLQIALALYGERISGASLTLNDSIGLIISVANAFLWLQPIDGAFIEYGFTFSAISAAFVVVFAVRMLLSTLVLIRGQVR